MCWSELVDGVLGTHALLADGREAYDWGASVSRGPSETARASEGLVSCRNPVSSPVRAWLSRLKLREGGGNKR